MKTRKIIRDKNVSWALVLHKGDSMCPSKCRKMCKRKHLSFVNLMDIPTWVDNWLLNGH